MFESSLPFTYLFDLLGVAVFAVSGALSAGRKRLDLLGVLVLSVVTSIGGGTIRDLLMGRFPIFWIADPTYLIIIVIASLFTMLYTRAGRVPGKALLIADAFGLAFFAVTGTKIAEAQGVSPIISVMMGAITGVAGGAIRDVLTAEIPLILKRDIYAAAAAAGSIAYLICVHIASISFAADWIGFSVIVLLRLAAINWHLRLPTFSLSEKSPKE